MTSQNVKVNSFFKVEENSPFIDNLSKFLISIESVLGLNRLPLIFDTSRRISTFLSVAYSMTVLVALIYLTCRVKEFGSIPMFLSFVEYIFCIMFSFITWRRMERYYCELNRFDMEFGCRPRVVAASIRNLMSMLVFTTCVEVFHVLCWYYDQFPDLYITVVPLNLIHCVELYYYGHLLSLISPRLRLINYYVKSALANGKSAVRPRIDEFPSFKYKNAKNNEMHKLMDMYHVVIKAYDLLIDAIKWQLLVILITSFGITLNFCYHVSLSIIRNENPFLDIVTDMGMTTAEMLPLFSPCVFGDRVHNEVRHLRELLASRLYENNLDKSGRSAARALLALTEARDLSFSLLRMLQIDISLPFKFIGLLVTYLIILLQFEKVISNQS